MEHEKNTTKKSRGGKHFTYEDRVRLETFVRLLYPRGKKVCFSRIAKLMGKHRTTISREFKKGLVTNRDSQLREFVTYSAEKGRQVAERASLNKGPAQRFTNRIATRLKELIVSRRMSPYAAVETLKKSGEFEWVPCERHVYYAIDSGILGIHRKSLPYGGKDRTRRKYPRRMAYTNSRGRSISERPSGAEDRSEYGHWEMDTVLSGKGKSTACLLVLTERKGRDEIIRKIRDRTQESVARALNAIERSSRNIFATMKSLTCDNGCEFIDPDAIEKSALHKGTRCTVYYAHPYSAFERGSNENANRIIRRFIPKGADISKYTNKQIQQIEDWINNLPRKILGGLSAAETIQLYFERETA